MSNGIKSISIHKEWNAGKPGYKLKVILYPVSNKRIVTWSEAAHILAEAITIITVEAENTNPTHEQKN